MGYSLRDYPGGFSMKKGVIALSITGLSLLIVSAVLFYFLPYMLNGAGYALFDPPSIWPQLLPNLKGLFTSPFPLLFWIAVSVAGVIFILLVIHLILLIAKKRPIALLQWFSWLIGSLVFLFLLFILLYVKDGAGFFGSEENKVGGFVSFVIDRFAGGSIPVWAMLVYLLPVLLALVGWILLLIAHIMDMVYINKAYELLGKQEDEAAAANLSETTVIADDDVPSLPESENSSKSEQPASQPAASASYQGLPTGGMIQGPFLVQYINTYSPASAENGASKNASTSVPLSEVQGAITGDKPLTAEEIRKIIKEELEEKKEPAQPVIVSVPAPVEKKEEEKAITADEVRKIFAEELRAIVGEDKKEDVVIEEIPQPKASLTSDDVRSIIKEELASSEPKEEAVPEKKEDVRSVIKEELAAFRAKEAEDARLKAEEETRQKEAEEEKRKEEANRLTPNDIRRIIAEELSRQAEEEPKNALTPEDIRDIIRSEMRGNAIQEEKVAPVTVIIRDANPAPAPVVEEKEEEPKPEEKPVEPEPEPVVEEKEEPVKAEPAVTQAPVKRVVGAINPNLPPHDKIIRIPFPTRMLSADKDLQDNYNELKSDIMAYGAKSRVSNSGDTFRLHKVTFVKITIAGKGLKLYFALDPKDYENSPLPVLDAGHKGTYKDIPLVFKVKSDLSMRRAKQLIADVMAKNGLEQGKIESHDWAADLKDYKPAGSDKDED